MAWQRCGRAYACGIVAPLGLVVGRPKNEIAEISAVSQNDAAAVDVARVQSFMLATLGRLGIADLAAKKQGAEIPAPSIVSIRVLYV
jgi:hypothetical protein